MWKQPSDPFQKSCWDNPFLPLPWPHHRKHIKASQTINPHHSATIIPTPPWRSRSFKPLSCRWPVYLGELKNTYQWLRLPIVAEPNHDTTVKRQSGLDKWKETGSREVREQEPKYFLSHFRVWHIFANHTFPKKLQYVQQVKLNVPCVNCYQNVRNEIVSIQFQDCEEPAASNCHYGCKRKINSSSVMWRAASWPRGGLKVSQPRRQMSQGGLTAAAHMDTCRAAILFLPLPSNAAANSFKDTAASGSGFPDKLRGEAGRRSGIWFGRTFWNPLLPLLGLFLYAPSLFWCSARGSWDKKGEVCDTDVEGSVTCTLQVWTIIALDIRVGKPRGYFLLAPPFFNLPFFHHHTFRSQINI